MIDFIIVEEELLKISTREQIIEKVMINYDIDYKVTTIDNIMEKSLWLLEKRNFKIYLININNTKEASEMIHYIREVLDDWQSLIIVFYKNIEEKKELEKQKLFILDYLEIGNREDSLLQRDLQIALKNYDQRPNSLKYCYKSICYSIDYWKIMYIEKDKEEKKCIIHTIDKDYYYSGCLNKIEEKIDKRFLKCNRATLINLEQIEYYDIKANKIVFHNQKIYNGISREKKKRIINYLRGLKTE